MLEEKTHRIPLYVDYHSLQKQTRITLLHNLWVNIVVHHINRMYRNTLFKEKQTNDEVKTKLTSIKYYIID